MRLALPAILSLLLTQLNTGSAFNNCGGCNKIINNCSRYAVIRKNGITKLNVQPKDDDVDNDDDSTLIIIPSGTMMSRRQMFGKGASVAAAGAAVAASMGSLPGTTARPAYAAADNISDDEFETIISQKILLDNLASAPVRNVIITGANSGVGLAGAKLLVAAGHHVTLACRTKAKSDVAAQACLSYAAAADSSLFSDRRPGGTAVGAECDLSSFASIRGFVESVKKEDGLLPTIDSLVLNAGLAHGQGETDVYRTKEGFEETVGVNHLGHFYLFNLLAPTLAKGGGAGGGEAAGGGGPRLVSTASGVHDPKTPGGDVGAPATLGSLSGLSSDGSNFSMVDGGPYDPDKAYKDSKLCNILFMLEASRRYGGKFTVNAFSPGLIADPNGFFRNQNKAFATVFNRITKVAGVASTNEFGGSALAYLAVDPAVEGLTGGWYDQAPPGKFQLAKHAPSVEAQNVEEQKLLWDLSSKLVGI